MLKFLAVWGRALVLGPILAVGLAAAPAAHAFDEQDAGVYAVYDAKGQITPIAYRFYLRSDNWVAEERNADGSWAPFVCKTECEIKTMSDADVAKLFGKQMQEIIPKCLRNADFAVCSYTLVKNPGKPRFLMMVGTPRGTSMVHLGWLASI